MPRHVRTLGALGLAALVGCAQSHAVMHPPEPRPLGRDIPTFVAPPDPSASGHVAFQEPAGELTLGRALALALLRSPDLAAVSWQVRVREAEALQAGLRPNPELDLELENVAGSGALSGFESLETTVSLSQLIELGGKRAHRVDVAGHEESLARWDFEEQRLQVLTGVARAFVSVLVAQQREQISRDLVTVAEQFLETVARRVRAGAVSSVEETRARVALSSSRLELETAGRRLSAERRRLGSLWGTSSPRFTRARGNLNDIAGPVPLERLLALVERNPGVARGAAELGLRRADVERQRSLAVPDVAILGGVRRLAETSDHALVLGISTSLPVLDRNQGDARAAEYRLARAREERRAARLAVETAVVMAHEVRSAAHREITTLDREILPDAEFAVETARAAYRRGLFRLTDVLDTQRTLFELRARRVDALERYHHATAELEGLIGDSMTGLEGD